MSRRKDSVTDFGHTLWHQKRIRCSSTCNCVDHFWEGRIRFWSRVVSEEAMMKKCFDVGPYCLKSKTQNFCTMYTVGGCWMCLSWTSPESWCLCLFSCLHFVKFSSFTWGVSSLFLCKRAQPQNVKWTWEETRALHTVFMTSVAQRELWIDNDVT